MQYCNSLPQALKVSQIKDLVAENWHYERKFTRTYSEDLALYSGSE